MIGILGLSDVANYADLIQPRITAHELQARLPLVECRRLAPFGWERPIPMDGGWFAEPIGQGSAERRSELPISSMRSSSERAIWFTMAMIFSNSSIQSAPKKPWPERPSGGSSMVSEQRMKRVAQHCGTTSACRLR